MKPQDLNPLGVPYADLLKVAESVARALGQFMQDGRDDPMGTWPTVKAPAGHKTHPVLESELARQMLRERNSGKRWDRLRANKKSPDGNRWILENWILSNWAAFIDNDEPLETIETDRYGLCYFTDETAAEWVSNIFTWLEDFTKKQMEDFRKKYGLIQVPLEHRRAGTLVKNVFTVTRIGRRSV